MTKLTSQTSVFLDVVRGFTAQFVLIGHLLSFYGVYGFDEKADHFIIQNFGVTVFFILSGFLIAFSVNNKNSSYSFRNYFIDRFSRIYISYLPALLFVFLLDTYAGNISRAYLYDDFIGIKQFVGNLLMLQDFPLLRYLHTVNNLDVNITSFGSGRPFWTIAIEWWIYLLFGFLFFKKLSIKNFYLWALLLIVPFYSIAISGNSLALSWFLGVVIFYFFANEKYPKKKNWNYILLLLLAAMARLYFNRWQVYDLQFLILFSFAFFFLIREIQFNDERYKTILKFTKVAKTLAGFSFSLYLLHYTIIVFIINLKLGVNKWLEMGLIFLVCNIIAYLFASVTEFRYHEFRRFIKRKFFTRKPSSQPV